MKEHSKIVWEKIRGYRNSEEIKRECFSEVGVSWT